MAYIQFCFRQLKIWKKKNNIGHTMVAEHKMNPPFKHNFSFPQIHFLLKIIFSIILTNLDL